MTIESNLATVKPIDRLRWTFRHGDKFADLDRIFSFFAPGAYLSAYRYEVVETDGDKTVFDVFYDPETATSHDMYLELDLVFRSLGLKVT